ncbi:MAG: M23 family metallopeptidase [Bacilli bacterium]|nr:M23 family metallopeptidase [Bacilli bacterium]
MKRVYFFLIKGLVCIILFLGLGIACKLNVDYKNYIYEKVYQDHFDFSGFKDLYNKYFGGIFPIENIYFEKAKLVFNEKLVYQGVESYEDGVMLSVGYNYLVPAVNSGIVVYLGEKDKYGNVVIVEGDNDIDIWYGNLCNNMVKLYDVVSNGDYLGESCDNKIYIVYTKKNEFLSYEDYLD